MKKTTTSTRTRAPAKRAPANRPPRRTRAATAVADAIAEAVVADASGDAMAPTAAPIEAAATPVPQRARKPVAPRRVRQACRLSEDEYARLGALKKRAGSLARPMKRGELLRAGLHVLLRMPDDELFRALDALPAAPAD